MKTRGKVKSGHLLLRLFSWGGLYVCLSCLSTTYLTSWCNVKSFPFVQCHWIVKAVMAFYFSWTAQNMLKKKRKGQESIILSKRTIYAFLTSAVVALFIPSNKWLETVLLPFPIKKLECLYLWVYASTSATFIVITLSISMQTGMLDFSGTAQKVQLVQH